MMTSIQSALDRVEAAIAAIPDDLVEQYQGLRVSRESLMRIRQQIIGEHQITLTDYEVANLKELLRAVGWPWKDDMRSPFNVANTGDWVDMIAQKLPEVDYYVNAPAEAMAQNAREWRDLSR